MSKFRFTLNIMALAAFMLMATSMANAQATRTWVSGVGDDVNPCSRTAPCKTFAGAISKTAAGGEIDALDPGGFGTVTITKSLTIDGTTGAGFGAILASGASGVVVNDVGTAFPGTSIVTLRNLSINGAGTSPGVNGIRFLSGKTLNVENCRIFGFTAGNGFGIDVFLTLTDKNVFVKDTNIFNCNTGIRMTTSTGFLVAVLDNVHIEHMSTAGSGVALQAGAFATIRDSVISRLGTGVNITGGANSSANLHNTTIFSCTTGIAVGGSTSRITHSSVISNGTGVSFAAGGSLRSSGDNFFDANTTPFTGGALTLVGQQ